MLKHNMTDTSDTPHAQARAACCCLLLAAAVRRRRRRRAKKVPTSAAVCAGARGKGFLMRGFESKGDYLLVDG
jgi:hypothetical protein